MTTVEPGRSAKHFRWVAVVGLVFVAQLGIIIWLGRTGPLPAAQSHAPKMVLFLFTAAPGTNTALADPTLFALPHRQSFSGSAWMGMPSLPFSNTNFVWSEPPRWIELPANRPDSNFREPALINAFSLVEAIADTQVEPRFPADSGTRLPPRRSTWSLSGELAGRQLLTKFELTSQHSDELLTNSVVQLVVDARGRPMSYDLLGPGSGSKDADQQALRFAGAARFAPLPGADASPFPDTPSGLRWGELIFQWQTVPHATTNAPPAQRS